MKTALNQDHKKELVLTKALLNLASFYDLSGKELAQIIGLSEASITRLHQSKAFISPKSKEGEIVLLLLRIYRGLNALLGNHHEKARLWLNSYNHYFNNKPIDHLKSLSGLVQVLQYLDAMRARL